MSFGKSEAKDAPAPRRRIKVRARRPPPSAPPLARVYSGALPVANVFARVYLYEYLARFEDANALGWPPTRLDAVHCWDDYVALQILQRLAVHLGGLTELASGQPSAGCGALVRALRRHMDEPEAPAPWIAAHSMLERAHVPPYDLEEVSVDLPVWRRPAAKKAQEPIMPRRTRSTTRLVDAVAQLDDDMDLDEPEEGTRRSRRAEQLAAKKRSDDLRERAERVLGPQALGEEEEEEEEDGEPMHLESKIACLVRLCDLMSTPKGVPASSSMHRLVQPLIDSLPALEKEAREHVAKVKSECEATMNALQKKAPSMVSPRYNAWKEERKNLGLANDHAVRTAQAEQYVSVARCTPRSGPLGRDLDGNEYWHLCPGTYFG